MLTLPFSEHEDACNSAVPVQNAHYFTFFLLSSTFLQTSDHLLFYFINILIPKLLGMLRLGLPSPHLADIWTNFFFATVLGISVFGLLRFWQVYPVSNKSENSEFNLI